MIKTNNNFFFLNKQEVGRPLPKNKNGKLVGIEIL